MLRKRSWWSRCWLAFWLVGLVGLAPSLASAEKFLVTVVDARIAKKKANGKNWDFAFGKSKRPDAFVVITLGKHKLKTPVVRNSLAPRWNISRTYDLSDTDTVSIEVLDRDRLSRNDLIGKTSLSVKELRKHSSITFGQVLALRIKMVSLVPPRPRPRVVARRTPPPRTRPRTITPPSRRRATTPPPRHRVAAKETDKVRIFCLTMIQHSLGCMKQQQAAFLKSGDKRKLKIAIALSKAVTQVEEALKHRGRVFETMMRRCRSTIQREGWKVSQTCLACSQKQGCVSSQQLKKACRDVCLKKSAQVLPTAPPLAPPPRRDATRTPPPARRDAQPVPPPARPETSPNPPPVRRDAQPTPPPRRNHKAAPARREAPVARREAPKARKEEPTARREAPEARREAPEARREAPEARREAPKARKEAPHIRGEAPATRGEAPAGRGEAPAARGEAPVVRRKADTRPAKAGEMTSQTFCARFVSQRIQCLAATYKEQKSKDGKKARVELLATLLKRYRSQQKETQAKCVKGLEVENAKRAKAGNPKLTGQRLAACWACLQKAGCVLVQQRACRKLCTQ